MSRTSVDQFGLPAKPFLYTIDQIAGLLELEEVHIRNTILFYEGRSPGVCPKDKLRAINIMPEGTKPEWRVAERNLIAWMRFKGLRRYTRGYA